jgi:periplasmic copper chaperone A
VKLIGRIPAVLGTASIGLVLAAAPALAHVTANPSEAATGSYTSLNFRVSHGCDGSSTTKVAVHVPDGVVSVKPQEVAGWTIDIATGPITPYDSHGKTVSEGVNEVSWTGGPLPDDHMQQFGLSLKLPDKAGETVYFPVVQSCQQGVTRWIEIPVAGQDEPEHPAAAVKLLAKGDDAASQAVAKPAAQTSDEAAKAEPAAQVRQVKDNGRDPLALVALVVGVAALLTSGAALFRKRG